MRRDLLEELEFEVGKLRENLVTSRVTDFHVQDDLVTFN